jgi:hypothetical protein
VVNLDKLLAWANKQTGQRVARDDPIVFSAVLTHEVVSETLAANRGQVVEAVRAVLAEERAEATDKAQTMLATAAEQMARRIAEEFEASARPMLAALRIERALSAAWYERARLWGLVCIGCALASLLLCVAVWMRLFGWN